MKDYIATYPIGLPISAIKRLQEIAQERYLPPTVMARGWLLERLEAEDRKEDRIPAPGAEFEDNTPARATQHTPNGVVADA